MRTLWYLIRMLVFPLRLLIYWWHSMLVFFSKPGAKLIVPIVLVGAGLALRTFIDPVFGASITEAAQPLSGTALFDYRIELAFAVLFMVLYVMLLMTSKVLLPIVGTFPAPKRPLLPMRPLIIRPHKVRSVRATLAVGKPVRGYFNGKLSRLNRRLPPEIQEILNRPMPNRPQSPPAPPRQHAASTDGAPQGRGPAQPFTQRSTPQRPQNAPQRPRTPSQHPPQPPGSERPLQPPPGGTSNDPQRPPPRMSQTHRPNTPPPTRAPDPTPRATGPVGPDGQPITMQPPPIP